VEPGLSSWGSSWGLSWGSSFGPTGVVPVPVTQVVMLGQVGGGGGGWTSLPRYGEAPPVIRMRPSLPGAKARRLGDAEQPLGMESADSLSRRGGLGGGIGRVQRVVRPSVGVAAAGLGGPAPAPAPGGPGGRPREPGDVQIV
jgi:hypothetical protein